MPLRISLRPISGRSNDLARLSSTLPASICPFCSIAASNALRAPRRSGQKNAWSTIRRAASTVQPPPTSTTSDARKELATALTELQKHAANYVNLSRVQLALRGLQQQPGHESIRIAIMGIDNGHSGRTAKELLRVILADPLKDEQDWERQLDAHDTARPLLIRIGRNPHSSTQTHAPLEVTRPTLLTELNISSPALDNHNLELLVLDKPLPNTACTHSTTVHPSPALLAFEESLLVPTVDIPTSASGRHTPVTTPVHRALLVADGILGATRAAALPLRLDRDELAAAVDLRAHADDTSGCPFMTVNVATAAEAVGTLRRGVEHAMEYERGWNRSNVAAVRDWMKLGSREVVEEGETKMPVRKLVASVLGNARVRIQIEEEKLRGMADGSGEAAAVAGLERALAVWAERAHAELQSKLDEAFASCRWRKLGWWKLFWRVDDVTMLSSELVTRHFVPDSERQLIYLTGRIKQARLPGLKEGLRFVRPMVASEEDNIGPTRTIVEIEHAEIASSILRPSDQWPTHIAFTRNYLLNTTIPALQALAQKLVLQTATTTTLTTSLAALTYLSSYGAYEAGAVGALGLVWSLGRMQKRWETAREFWQGEVTEEARKAVRITEEAVAEALEQGRGGKGDALVDGEIKQARELIQKAEELLGQLK